MVSDGVVSDPPEFTLRVPIGWDAFDGPPGMILLRPARQPGGFRTNVLVTHAEAGETVDLDTLMDDAARHLHERAHFAIHGERRAGGAAFESMLRLASFDACGPVPTDTLRVAQLHAVYLACAGSVTRPALELIATCAFDELEAHAGAWEDLLASVALTHGPTLAS